MRYLAVSILLNLLYNENQGTYLSKQTEGRIEEVRSLNYDECDSDMTSIIYHA